MTRSRSCEIEPLESRRLFAAGDLAHSEPLPGAGNVVARELIHTSDHKLLALAAPANGNVSVARIEEDSQHDITFGNDGWITTDVRRDAIAGKSTFFSNPDNGAFGFVYNNVTEIGIAAVHDDGPIDLAFGGGDRRWQADFRLSHAAIQSDGKIVVAGTEKVNVHRRRAIVRRLNADGSPDASFSSAGRAVLGIASNVSDLVIDARDRVTLVANVFLNSS